MAKHPEEQQPEETSHASCQRRIVGCGTISAAYLRAAKVLPEYRIVACADLDRDRTAARAAEFGLQACTVQELFDDRSIEIVLNLTIPVAHAEIGLRAIEAGKHVYSEKPLGLAVREAGALVETARARGVRVGCAPDTFLAAHTRAFVRRWMKAGSDASCPGPRS